jgi:hypothetical protein
VIVYRNTGSGVEFVAYAKQRGRSWDVRWTIHHAEAFPMPRGTAMILMGYLANNRPGEAELYGVK